MDLDERDGAATTTAGPGEVKLDKVLVKDEAYVVSERKGLPQEVEQIVVAGGASSSRVEQNSLAERWGTVD